MFAPFEQFNADHSAGLGLGLALSGGFAGAMGATLIAEDIPGGGSPWCCPCPWRPRSRLAGCRGAHRRVLTGIPTEAPAWTR